MSAHEDDETAKVSAGVTPPSPQLQEIAPGTSGTPQALVMNDNNNNNRGRVSGRASTRNSTKIPNGGSRDNSSSSSSRGRRSLTPNPLDPPRSGYNSSPGGAAAPLRVEDLSDSTNNINNDKSNNKKKKEAAKEQGTSDSTSTEMKKPLDRTTTAPAPLSLEQQQQQQQQQQQASGSPGALPPIPEVIDLGDDPDNDSFGFRAILETLTNPQMFMWVRAAFRVTTFVSFPMLTISIHPNTMFKLGFPQMVIAAVLSTSACRPTLGEQIGLHSWTWRGMTYLLILGSVFDSWNPTQHIGAWWGLIAAGIFGASLCTNGGIRRFLFLYFFVYMMELRMYAMYFGAVPENNAAWLAADCFMGTFFGIAANLFPYPVLTSSLTDLLMGKMFAGIGKMLQAMQSFLVSPLVHAGSIFYNDTTPFDRVEELLMVMPPLLWFTNWEPWEFPVRNPVRRLKLSLLRRVMALMYSAFRVGREVVSIRRQMADKAAMQRIRIENWMEAHAGDSTSSDDGGSSDDAAQKMMDEHGDNPQTKFFLRMKEAYGEDRALEMQGEMKTLRTNTIEQLKAMSTSLMEVITLIGSVGNKPGELVKGVPFRDLAEKDTAFHRNRRVEVLQMLNVQAALVANRRERRKKEEEDKKKKGGKQQQQHRGVAAAHNSHNSSQHQDRVSEKNRMVDGDNYYNRSGSGYATPVEGLPYGGPSMDPHHLQQQRQQRETEKGYNVGKESAMEILDYQDILDDMDVYLSFQEMFFAMLMSMIAGELIAFGESMIDYKPEAPMRTRLWNYFIAEPWHDFWDSVWGVLTMRTPADVRTWKDAVKMTTAFLSACAMNLEIWVPQGGTYYFGTTILLGFPVEEETLGLAVNRMAGNTLGCALGYLSYNNTKNLSEKIGLILVFAFVCQCARNHPIFGQTFFYAGIICMAGMITSIMILELLVRTLASCYTVMAYMLSCMFIFPTNPIQVLWGYRIKLVKAMSETIDDVAAAARLPLLFHSNSPLLDEYGGSGAHRRPSYPYGDNTITDDANERGGAVDRPTVALSHNVYNNNNSSSNNNNNSDTQQDEAAVALQQQQHLLDLAQQDELHFEEIDQFMAQLNVDIALNDRLLAMCSKWTPFAAAYPIMRGIQPFPREASMLVHGIHLRMTSTLRMLVFAMQLIHRPRSDTPNAALRQLLGGSVAQFLSEFADLVRLIFQDFVHSLQSSRTWSYPRALMYQGHLMQLRVRLHAILYKAHILIGIPTGRGTIDLRRGDAQRMLNDTRHAAASPMGTMEVRVVDDNDDDPLHAGGRPDFNENASFADRLLQDRLAASGAMFSHNPSLAASPGAELGRSFATTSGGYRHRAPLQESRAAPRDMFPFTQGDAEKEVAAELRRGRAAEAAADAAAGRPPRSCSHGGSTLPSPAAGAGDRTAAEPFAPTQPQKSPSRFARLVEEQPPQRRESRLLSGTVGGGSFVTSGGGGGGDGLLPRYDGPRFCFHEDDMDLPADTDLIALVAILSSCGTFMDDVEAMAAPVNTISGYQKQLHESSLCLGLIDAISNCVTKRRDATYDRYHHPAPPPQRKGPVNAQFDVWKEWRF